MFLGLGKAVSYRPTNCIFAGAGEGGRQLEVGVGITNQCLGSRENRSFDMTPLYGMAPKPLYSVMDICSNASCNDVQF